MTTTPNADPPAVSNASVQLLPVEPRRVFITWSVPSSGRSGEIFLALRDVTLIEFDEQRDYGRVDIGPVDVTGRYFVDVRPGRVYQARVEERRNGDPPRALAVSETVTTPSERPSLHEPPRSRPVRDAVVADSGDSGWQPRSSEPVATSSVDRQALERSHIELSAEDLFGRGSPKRKRSSERASRQQQEEELARSVTRDPATERGETAAKGAPAAAAGSKESGSVDDPAIRSTSQRGVTSSAGLAGGPSSADLLGGAVSSEALARGGSSEQLAGASEQLAGPGAPSSAGLGLRPLVEEAPDAGAADARDAALGMDEDALQLELHADVVVYGRAQPGSQVVIDGMQAPVQADGTFEVRFALNPSLRGPQGEA